MAKPIKPIPVFMGKAAIWLEDYLARAIPDPRKVAQAEEDKRVVARMKPLNELRHDYQHGS